MKKNAALIVIIVLVIASAFALRYRFSSSEVGEPTDKVSEFYLYKNTQLGDNSKVRTIVDLTNLSPYPVHSIELKTDEKPMRLTINFKVDDRSEHRYIDHGSFVRSSALIFSVVPNLDEISFLVFDNCSDVREPETCFDSSYVSREALREREGMQDFSPEYIAGSTKSLETFRVYHNAVLSALVPGIKRNAFLDEVYEFIGKDYEIVVNSSIAASFDIDDAFLKSSDCKELEKVFGAVFSKYSGKTVKIIQYDVRNFRNGGEKICVFVHYVAPEGGTIIAASKFLDTNGEKDTVKKQIVKRNGG